MIAESHTAVVDRNSWWQRRAASEPYEAGWAREAMIFVRALDVKGDPEGARARLQVSPDGIRWIDEGTVFPMPTRPDDLTFCRAREFGAWLRIAVDIPDGAAIKVLVTINVKQ